MVPQKKYYTVGVSNKFAAFGHGSDVSSDENDVILDAAPLSHEQPANTQTTNQIKPQRNLQQSPQKNDRKDTHKAGRGAAHASRVEERGAFRGGRGGADRGERVAPYNNNGESAEFSGEARVYEEGAFRGRGGRGGFRGRGGRGGFRGNREFDRHSGTGRGREVKKSGNGGHNWGHEEGEETQNVHKENVEGESQKENVEENAAQGEVEETEAVPVEPVEEDSIDYETYKQQLADRRANLPSFVSQNAKKATITTEKDLEADGYVRLERPAQRNDGDNASDAEELVHRDDARKNKSINVFEFIHNEGGRVNLFPQRRGSRGGARGRGGDEGRGAPRKPRGLGSFNRGRAAPDIADQHSFPTLG